MPIAIVGVIASGAVIALIAAAQRHAKTLPNVVLVVVCSLRYDHLGCSGYDRPTSPNIDALSAQSAVFSRCISQASWTKPSAASILTGLTPNVHRLTDYYGRQEILAGQFSPKHALAPGITTLAESLKDAGYETAAFVGNVHVWPAFGFGQGFDLFDNEDPLAAGRLVERFQGWLDTRPASDKPFFGFLLLKDVHHQYWPRYPYYLQFNRDTNVVTKADYPDYVRGVNRRFLPRPKRNEIVDGDLRRWIDLYDGQIRYVDDCLGRLFGHLKRLDVFENTIIVITSDHGDLLMEHDLTNHAHWLYQELVRVPLIIKVPGLNHQREIGGIARSIDIMPTILDAVGAEPPEILQGLSLMPLVSGTADGVKRPPRTAFSTIFGDTHAVQNRQWKFERKGPDSNALYRIDVDPGEHVNVAGEHGEQLAAFEQILAQILSEEERLRTAVEAPGRQTLDERTIEQLRSLGYVGK